MNAYFSLCGRLGNQLFILAACLYIKYKYNFNSFIEIPNDLDEYSYSYLNYFKDITIDTNLINYDNTKNIFIPYPNWDIEQYLNNDKDIKFIDTLFQHYKFVTLPKVKNDIINFLNNYTVKNNTYNNLLQSIKNNGVNNSVFISVRRGDYFPFYYVLNKDFYIDSYNKYFLGKHIYISSDDIDWCKTNLTQNQFNNSPSITYITNLSPITILNLSTLFKNYILANSTFSAMIDCLSDNIKHNTIAFHTHKPDFNPKFMFMPNSKSYDIKDLNKKYLDPDGQLI